MSSLCLQFYWGFAKETFLTVYFAGVALALNQGIVSRAGFGLKFVKMFRACILFRNDGLVCRQLVLKQSI